jgi:hypothetical protein
MSNYFQTLKRLERENARNRTSGRAPAPRVEPVTPEGLPLSLDDTAQMLDDRSLAPQVIEQPNIVDERTVGGFAALFDNLRALGNGAPVGTLVVCGASTVESIERISGGLATEVARNDVRVLVAELYRAGGHPMLRVRMASPTEKSQAARYGTATDRAAAAEAVAHLPKPIRLELRGGPVPEVLSEWLAAAHATYQMVIIEAPPLGVSIDAAMVARACDGLVLVVEARATPRAALRESIERADTVGCQILGIVMEGTPEWTPLWLRRIAAMRNLF